MATGFDRYFDRVAWAVNKWPLMSVSPSLVPLSYEVAADGVLYTTFDPEELKLVVSNPANKHFLIKNNQGKILGLGLTAPIRRALYSQEDSLLDNDRKPPSSFQSSYPVGE